MLECDGFACSEYLFGQLLQTISEPTQLDNQIFHYTTLDHVKPSEVMFSDRKDYMSLRDFPNLTQILRDKLIQLMLRHYLS